MSKKINVVMVGIGHHHADGIMQELLKHASFNVLGYYETNQDVLNEKSDSSLYKDLKKYSENDIKTDKLINALFIEAPSEFQIEYAEKFLYLALPMHLDKPVGIDSEKTVDFLKKMREKNISFQIGYMYRYNPALLKMKEMIADDKIGTIYNMEAVMNTNNSSDYREWLSTYSGGSMFVLGCHMIDIVYSIMGQPVSVTPYIKESKRDNVSSFDSCSATWEYNNGIANIQATCMEAGGYGRRRIIVSGEKGSIEIQPMENPTKMYYSSSEPLNSYSSDDKKPVDLSIPVNLGRYEYMLDDFAAIVNKESTALHYTPSYDYEISLQELIIKSCDIK